MSNAIIIADNKENHVVSFFMMIDGLVSGKFERGRVVAGEWLGDIERLLNLGAVRPVADSDVPPDAIQPPSTTPVAEEAPAHEPEPTPAEPEPSPEPTTEESVESEPASKPRGRPSAS